MAPLQDSSQWRYHVARLDRARCRFRKEGLVGHVRLRVDHGDGGFATPQLRLKLKCRVHAYIAAAEDENPGGFGFTSHADMVAPLEWDTLRRPPLM
ncbi:hypothetical protein GCM10027271_17580 [Saccharopolyspora gloriosae]